MLNTFRCFGKLPADANIDELVASVFSVFPVGEKAAGVFICDVMGHGVRSALFTSMIRVVGVEVRRTN